MKHKTIQTFALAIAILACAAGASAQILARSSSSLRVDGDSTLHKWTVATSSLDMVFQPAEGAPSALAEAIKASKIKGLEVKIRVADLHSGESGLDKNMRKAMNEEKFPNVVYRLDKYELTKGSAAGALAAKTSGQLTIAGRTRPAAIDVEFHSGPDGTALKGSYALKMSDFGIKPPTLMLGTIKVRDPVTIRFDLLLKNKEN